MQTFNEFYAKTDSTFEPYSFRSSLWKRKRWVDYVHLPCDSQCHIRGFVSPAHKYFYYVCGDESDARLPRQNTPTPDIEPIKPIVFHAHPTNDQYSDIPAWEDVYDFLNWRHRELVVIGRKYVSRLIKNDATLPLIEKLWGWEATHPYKKSRLSRIHPAELLERKYAQSALRGIGIKLPPRASTRQRKWPGIFEALGIEVNQIKRPK